MTRGRVESAFACVDAITDAVLLHGDVPRAASVLRKFIEQAPHIPALAKLVEISVDADMADVLRETQARLVDAYLEASRGEEAHIIAEDLLRADPASDVHADRLRRAARGTRPGQSGCAGPVRRGRAGFGGGCAFDGGPRRRRPDTRGRRQRHPAGGRRLRLSRE